MKPRSGTSPEADDDFFQWHAESSQYRGELHAANRTALLRNPVCGDCVYLRSIVSPDQRIVKIRFRSVGCLLSTAAASILCEQIEGKSLAVLQQLSDAEMIRLVRIPITPRRFPCVLLALRCLHTMLDDDYSKRKIFPVDSNSRPPKRSHR